MKVINPGHYYELANIKIKGKTNLSFYQDPVINGGAVSCGTNCQEVIRVLIDRVKFLDSQKPWAGNDEIINHLRQALALFECRAIVRKVETGEYDIESFPTGLDGHILISKE